MQGITPTDSAVDSLTLKELTARILTSGYLAYLDRQRLKQALLDEHITDDDLSLIEEVIEAVRQGTVAVG